MLVKATGVAKIVLVLVGLALEGCGGVVYKDMNGPTDDTDTLAPVVRYELKREFYSEPPRCVLVLPVEQAGDPMIGSMVENAATRRLYMKVARVIGAGERVRAARQDAYLLQDSEDLLRLARARNCGHYLRIRLSENERQYAVVWSARSIGIELQLAATADNRILWEASHTAFRGEGGLPISPLSLIGATVRAGGFQLDGEVTDSMLDDAMRRLFATLPDTR